MTAEMMDNLEARLARVTEWEGDAPEVWRDVLEAAEREDGAYSPSVIARILTMPLSRLAVAAAVVLLVSSVVTVLFLPTLGKARRSPSPAAGVAPISPTPWAAQQERNIYQGMRDYGGNDVAAELNDQQAAVMSNYFGPADGVAGRELNIDDGRVISSAGGGGGSGGSGDLRQVADTLSQPADRSVIRKADITLLVEDARAAFLRASMLINEASGEYVEDSSLTENRGRPEATVKLRVAADRLSEVMNALRELGEVKTEQMRGDDVTEQIVDLDARLRNEQRFEQELLELLDTRNDSPLKEVLELRDRISGVRQRIEQLQARQQQLGRMVSLATILVVLYEEQEEQEPEVDEDEEHTLGAYFTDAVSGSWTTGLHFLSDTIAMLVRVLVGGLIWWLIAIGALMAARRVAQRKVATAAA